MTPINSFNNSSVISIQGAEDRLLMKILLAGAFVACAILAMCWFVKSKTFEKFSIDLSRRVSAFANPPSNNNTDRGSRIS